MCVYLFMKSKYDKEEIESDRAEGWNPRHSKGLGHKQEDHLGTCKQIINRSHRVRLA